MIPVTGYLAEEKYQIAKNYLVPKQMEAHGLQPAQFKRHAAPAECSLKLQPAKEPV